MEWLDFLLKVTTVLCFTLGHFLYFVNCLSEWFEDHGGSVLQYTRNILTAMQQHVLLKKH